ncbi:MAG TPA: SMP-30/gluconolactonase/LRE family protein [Acetobacteraceae bacterium]|nr:SMP-30/gluconolactonase/LRE family protein [Acetobacteraceae bacterium]
MTHVEQVLEVKALNGESPAWSEARGELIWVDIRYPSINAFDPKTRRNRFWELPSWIGCFGLTETGAAMALRTGFYHLDFETGGLDFIAPTPFDQRRFIFNDGKCDRRGRFFAGTMFVPLKPGQHAEAEGKSRPLFRYDGAGEWKRVTDPVQTSNGLAWSPDGRRMYHSDTDKKLVWVYEYDEDAGLPRNKRMFADLSSGEGGPDGATVDSEGFYWCALFGGGELLRFDPSGKLERRVKLPTRFPSMPALGGEGLKTMFVTSANWKLPPEERGKTPDGDLFAFEAPAPGLPASHLDPRFISGPEG